MKAAKAHWLILLILAGAAFLLFADLGDDYLWEDEGDTAVLADNILEYGVPKAWDGVTLSVPDGGARLNQELVMVSHPWLQYYAAAASFLALGESAFAARFPFALAGWLTILSVYALVLRLTSDRRAAVSAALLLTLSVQFLLYARQCRNYALYMLLVCWLLLLFVRLTNWRAGLGFALLSGLLFHCNPAGLASLGALGLLTLVYAPCRPYRRWFWFSLPLTLALVVPWFLFAIPGYKANTFPSLDWRSVGLGLCQFLLECGSLTPLVGALLLLGFLWIRHSHRCRRELPPRLHARKRAALNSRNAGLPPLFTPGERLFLALTGMMLVTYAALLALTQGVDVLWTIGLRYAVPLLPLVMALTGILIAKVVGSSKPAWVVLLLALTLTNLGNIRPWSIFSEKPRPSDQAGTVAMHVPANWVTQLFKTSLVGFWRELRQENRGTVADISTFLKAHARTNDVLITNYEWEALYFHTGLPQGLKIQPNFPIYEAAKEHDLPDYVFNYQGVRWIVWRWAWEGRSSYKWEPLYRALQKHGAVIEPVAEFRDTIWENRSNLHFHRFPGYDYKFYPIPGNKPARASVFRVDWPKANFHQG